MSNLIVPPNIGSEELLTRGPDHTIINLTSANAEAINADPDWLRARILLGSLFRKHGPFLIEVSKLGVHF